MKDCLCLLGMDMFVDIMLEPVAELRHIAPFQRQACCIGVTTKVEQEIAATLDGRIDVEAHDGARRTRSEVAVLRQYDSRPEIELCQA